MSTDVLHRNNSPGHLFSRERVAASFLLTIKQRQRKRISLSDAARIVRVEVVSTVVTWTQLCWVIWVTQDLVKIDHGIEFAAAPNPVVYLLTNALFF